MAQTHSNVLQAIWLQLPFVIPQVLLLILLGCEVIRRRRREHLWWIGLMLAGQIVSFLGQFLNFRLAASGQPSPSPLPDVFVTIGYLVSTLGFVALLIAVYRSFKAQQVLPIDSMPNDVWPPAPRSNS